MCGLRRGGVIVLTRTNESTASVVRNFHATSHRVIVRRRLNVSIVLAVRADAGRHVRPGFSLSTRPERDPIEERVNIEANRELHNMIYHGNLLQNGPCRPENRTQFSPIHPCRVIARLRLCLRSLCAGYPDAVLLPDCRRQHCDDRRDNAGRAGGDDRVCRWEVGTSPSQSRKLRKSKPPARILERLNNLAAMDLSGTRDMFDARSKAKLEVASGPPPAGWQVPVRIS